MIQWGSLLLPRSKMQKLLEKTVMDDLSKYLEFLYEKEEGYVYVATKGQLDASTLTAPWNQEYFLWPTQQQEVHDYITLQGATLDVYVAPALFKAKNALKKTVKGSNVVWVEFDGQEQIDFADIPQPDCIVQTSHDTHVHCYWKIPYTTDIQQIEDINRRLTHFLEADSSGFDINQVLRPPLSRNWKYDRETGIEVVLAHFEPNPTKYNFSQFDSAPEVKSAVILLNSTMLLDVVKLLNDLPIAPSLKKKIISESVSPDSKARSSFMMKIAHELAEEGCNHIQIVSLIHHVDSRIGKFVGRSDRLMRLSEMASVALLMVEVEDGVTLYSPQEIIDYKENLEWLIPGILHTRGFLLLTGPPSAGKTTLALQLLKHMANGEDFMMLKTVEDTSSLFLSLEMSIIELKYSFTHHFNEYGHDVKWNQHVRITEDQTSLNEYEAIIEQLKPKVVLIDSMSELADEELSEREARTITRWIRKVRRKYNCAFIVIHHNRKESSGNGASKKRPAKLADVYGSYVFGKDVDTALNLERDDEDNSIIELYSIKTRFGTKVSFPLQQNENLVFSIRTKNDNQSSGPVAVHRINLGI